MKAQPTSDFSGAPVPSHLDEPKTIYQKRFSVTPTTTAQLAFMNSKADGKRTLDPLAEVMAYTPINGMEPTPDEKGRPTDQEGKGYNGIDLRAQLWNRKMK